MSEMLGCELKSLRFQEHRFLTNYYLFIIYCQLVMPANSYTSFKLKIYTLTNKIQ